MVEIRKIGDSNKEIKANGTPEFPEGVLGGKVEGEGGEGKEGRESKIFDITKGLTVDDKVPTNAYTDKNSAAAEGGAGEVLPEGERGKVLSQLLSGEDVNIPGLNLDPKTSEGAADMADLAMPGLK